MSESEYEAQRRWSFRLICFSRDHLELPMESVLFQCAQANPEEWNDALKAADDKIVAFIDGNDSSQRFYTAKEVERYLDADEKIWWASAKPGDMRRVVNGSYYPGMDAIVIKLGSIQQTEHKR